MALVDIFLNRILSIYSETTKALPPGQTGLAVYFYAHERVDSLTSKMESMVNNRSSYVWKFLHSKDHIVRLQTKINGAFSKGDNEVA